jgi:hypothetical protein
MKTDLQLRALWRIAVMAVLTGCAKPGSSTTSENQVPATPNQFLFLSDIHFGSNLHNQNGDYSSDTGPVLWTAAKAKISSVIQATSPKFVVYTGDLPAHTNSCDLPLVDSCHDLHSGNLEVVLQDLYALLPKGLPLFYAPGNNDGIAGDYYRFADANDSTPFTLLNPADNYPAPNASTPCGSAPCIVSPPNPLHGYYAAKAMDQLRIIALNSVILVKKYKSIGNVPPSTAGDSMMTWIGSQLAEASTAGDKVYFIMHVPPNQWLSNWRQQFLAYLEQYQSIITGVLFGHTHMDEQLVFYGVQNPNAVTEVGISCPGITPLFDNNPGFKTVSFDPGSTELIDFTTYWTTPGVTAWGDNTYSLRQTYGQPQASTLYAALQGVSNFNSDSILARMSQIYWVKNTPDASAQAHFPTTVAVR